MSGDVSRNSSVVCVLGMHRSGTALITRVLNLLGVYLGAEHRLMEASPDNPKGYWEHRPLTALNDAILERFGGSWHEPPAFPTGWEDAAELEDLRTRARALIREDFSGAGLWGWKDPRTCLTLPFWRRLIGPIRYVLCVRNVLDVARSLERRDGFSLQMGGRLWVTYLSSALYHTAGQPRLLLAYENLMAECPPEVARLARFIGAEVRATQPEVKRAIEEAIDHESRHHNTPVVETMDEARILVAARALYLALHTALHGDHETDDHELAGWFQEAVGVCARAAEQDLMERATAERPSEERGRELVELRRRLSMLEGEWWQLRDSLAWRAVSRYRRLLEAALPSGSRRRAAYARVLQWLVGSRKLRRPGT